MSSNKSAGVKKITTLRDLKETKKTAAGDEIEIADGIKVVMLTTPASYTMAQKTDTFMNLVEKVRSTHNFDMNDATLERFKTAFTENVEDFSLDVPDYSYTWKGQGKVDIRIMLNNDDHPILHFHEVPDVEVAMALMKFMNKIDKTDITFDADFEKQFAMSWWTVFLCAKMFMGPNCGLSGYY